MKKRLLMPLAALSITGYSIRGAAPSDDENVYPGINYLTDDELSSGAWNQPVSFALETPKEDLALLDGIEKERLDLVQTALSRGADPDAVSSDGDPALILAIKKGSPKIVAALLAKNAHVNKQGQYGYTPLMMALEMLTDEYEYKPEPIQHIIVQLMRKGADRGMLLRNNFGSTALHIAVLIDNSNFYGNNEKIFKGLLKVAGLNGIKAQDNDGNTPLMVAASHDSTYVMDALFAAGADGEALNYQNNEGNTALMIALKDGYLDAAEDLLDKGAQVSQTNDEGERALILAMKDNVNNDNDDEEEDDDDDEKETLQGIIQKIAAREAQEWKSF